MTNKLVSEALKEIKKNLEVIENSENTFDTTEQRLRYRKNYGRTKFNKYRYLHNLLHVVMEVPYTFRDSLLPEKDNYAFIENSDLLVLLAVQFNDNKDTLIKVLKAVNIITSEEDVDKINSINYPPVLSKEDIIEYLNNLPDVHSEEEWIKEGAGKSNIPCKWIVQSEYLYDKDVFKLLIEVIKNNINSCQYFLKALNDQNITYRTAISTDQKQALARSLNLDFSTNTEEEKTFINRYFSVLSDDVLDKLFNYVSKEKNTKGFTIHWSRFPKEYQKKYIATLPSTEARECIEYADWSVEEKIPVLHQISLKIK